MSEAVLPAGHATPAERAAAESQVGFRDALWLIGRALAYMKPFKWRFFAKWCFTVLSVLPVVFVPWPLKLLTDNVMLRQPVTAKTVAQYPPYLHWAVRLLEGAPPREIALVVVLVGVVTVVLVGFYGQLLGQQNTIGGYIGSYEINATRTYMGSGDDIATNSENEANFGYSYISGILGLIDYRWHLRLSQALNHYYRSQLFERIKSLPMTSLEDRRTGDMIYRVMYDTPMITRLVYDFLITPIAIFTFSLVVYVMSTAYRAAPEVIWLALAALPAYFIATLPFAAMMRRRSAEARVAGAATTSTIDESMSNIFAVQSLGGWARERARFEAASANSFRRYRGMMLVTYSYTAAAAVAGLLLYLAMCFTVASHVVAGTYTVGDFAVLSFYYLWMSGSTANFAQMWIRSQDNVVGLKRAFALLDLRSEDEGGARVLPPVRQGVRLEDVTLVYPDGRRALETVSFEARVGEITAIVGATGAGKTSAAHLVPRYHRPTSGRVLIDGFDVADLSLESLRGQIAYVFQDTQLFSMSVADNIRYGRPEASLEAVVEAAGAAGAHGFIMAQPQGYDTDLGAGGAKLSVGQRQRISIARALIMDAPILILDEPTSALDPETERHLVEALEGAARGRCVIVIAHRLSTIAHADKVVFLENGRVREQGRPDELIARPGSAYGRFARLQAGD